MTAMLPISFANDIVKIFFLKKTLAEPKTQLQPMAVEQMECAILHY